MLSAALGLFVAGATVSVTHGIQQLLKPEPAGHFAVGYIVLGVSFVLEAVSFRHVAPGTAGEKVHRAERRYGAFRRSITLPRHVQADKIEATSQDGVLQILVPNAEEVHAKRIQVRPGKGKPAVAGSASKNGA